MPQNFYELVWIFIIYAFIGWCTEVSYAALDRGIFVNRGFLNGPYCPIYGCGVVIVVAALTPLNHFDASSRRFLRASPLGMCSTARPSAWSESLISKAKATVAAMMSKSASTSQMAAKGAASKPK